MPCVGSDIAPLVENARGGGCLLAKAGSTEAWIAALRSVLTDDPLYDRLVSEAQSRPLPTWAEAAETLRSALS